MATLIAVAASVVIYALRKDTSDIYAYNIPVSGLSFMNDTFISAETTREPRSGTWL